MYKSSCLSLEISALLFFFPFLFSTYCCSVDLLLFVLFLAAVISLSLLFFMLTSSRRIDASMQSTMLVSPLPPPFLDIYNQSVSSLG